MMNIIQNPSPNYSSRTAPIKLIVVHWTGGTKNSTLSWFSTPESKVSAHYVIDVTGITIYQCVHDDRVAWHAGYSKWNDTIGCNGISIGIELIGPPTFLKLSGWATSQIDTLVDLTNKLITDHPSIVAVTDHSTIRSEYIEYAKQHNLTIPPAKQDVKTGTGPDAFPWTEYISRIGLFNGSLQKPKTV